MKASRPLIFVIVIVLVLAGSGFYYYSQVTTSPSAGAVTINITIVGGATASSIDTYSPDNFTVHLGQRVTLVVLDTDDNGHGLVINQFGVDTGIIQPSSAVRVTFTPNKVGTFEYYEPPGYCTGGISNKCTSIQRMTGTMTVLP